MEKNPQAQKIYGVLGFPAKHSLSPRMHNAAFSALKINARYEIFEKNPQELGGFLKSLSENSIYGLNITVPYKEKVFPYLTGVSKEAELIGAVNTIKVTAEGLEGFNTDGEGFLRHLTEDLGFEPKSKSIAVIGAGGASRAITVYLAQRASASIRFYDPEQQKAIALAEHLSKAFPSGKFQASNSIAELNLEKSDLLINASPVGMKEDDPLLVPEELLHKNLLVCDLIYNPAETPLLKSAKINGARASGGLGMLLYQGMLSFQIWTGQDAPEEIMRSALEEGLKNVRTGL